MAKDIRTLPFFLAPFASFLRDFGDIVRNPVALFGGLLGTAVMTVAIYFSIGLVQDVSAGELEDDELDMEFLPGELMRKGPELEEKELPEKIIVEELVAEESTVEETVTKDENTPPPPEEEKKKDKPKEKKSKEKPDPNAKKDAKKADRNQKSNTPHDDLPTVDQLPGNPFAGPNGWSDMAKDGDPWATAVIGALNGLALPAFAGIGKPGAVSFQITICSNGTIKKALVKKIKGEIKKNVFETEVERIKIPKPPANVAKQLKGGCKKIPYKFVWSTGGGSKGKVR